MTQNNKIQFVDLGLPHGTLWADRNIGANAPEDFGDFFAWGDIETQKSFSMENYKYYKNENYVDIGEDISGSEYDVATARLGNPFRLPTLKEAKYLVSKTYCIWEPITQNGIDGHKVTSVKNGNSIFMPFAGIMMDEEPISRGSSGHCWTSAVAPHGQWHACQFAFEYYKYQKKQIRHQWAYTSRHFGLNIRAVCRKLISK